MAASEGALPNLLPYVLLALTTFAIGLFGALSRRNAIVVMMSLELMANGVNINLVALSRYVTPDLLVGQMFAIFVMVVSAAEVGLGLAIVLSIYRRMRTIDLDSIRMMKW